MALKPSQVDLKDSDEYGRLELVAMPTGPRRPLMECVAREGFYSLPQSFLQALCTYLCIEADGTSTLAILKALCYAIIPELTDDEFLSILSQRGFHGEDEHDLSSIVNLEYVIDCFDVEEKKRLKGEILAAKTQKAVHTQFLEALHKYKVEKGIFRKRQVGIKRPAHPLYKKKFPGEMPVARDDLPQHRAKTFMPPKTYIWRSNQRGEWHVHVPGHKRHHEAWACHGNSSFDAMTAAVRWAWRLWRSDHNAPLTHIPIRGLFPAE